MLGRAGRGAARGCVRSAGQPGDADRGHGAAGGGVPEHRAAADRRARRVHGLPPARACAQVRRPPAAGSRLHAVSLPASSWCEAVPACPLSAECGAALRALIVHAAAETSSLVQAVTCAGESVTGRAYRAGQSVTGHACRAGEGVSGRAYRPGTAMLSTCSNTSCRQARVCSMKLQHRAACALRVSSQHVMRAGTGQRAWWL